MTRKQAQAIVVSLKGICQNDVSKKTTLLVIGSFQSSFLEEYKASKKLLAAQRLEKAGSPIQITNEKEFLTLIAQIFQLLSQNL